MAKVRKLIVVIVLAVFLFSIFQLGKVFGDSVPIVISSVEAYASSSDVGYESLTYDDTNISNRVTFRKIGDSVRYVIKIKNTSNKKYRINLDAVTDDSTKDYISYENNGCSNVLLLPDQEKELNVIVKYAQGWTDVNDRIQIENVELVFSYDEEHDPIPDPENTVDNQTENTVVPNTVPDQNTTPEQNTILDQNTTPEQNTVPEPDVKPEPPAPPSGGDSGSRSDEGQYSKGRRVVRRATSDYDDTIAPYATLPQTGDKIGLYIFLACTSCILLIFMLRKPSESLTSIESRYKKKKDGKVNQKELLGLHAKTSLPKLIIRNVCILAILALFVPIAVKAATVQKIKLKNTLFLYDRFVVCYVIDGNETTELVKYDTTITQPADPVKPGYRFEGWTDDDGNPFDFSEPINDDVVIKAKFELETYDITYVLNGGYVSEGNLTTYTINDEFTLNNPTKTGYEFIGWKKNGSTTPVKDMTVSHEYGNITFTACYEPNHYTVVFNGNGDGDVEGSTDSQGFTYDVEQELNENGFTRPDKVFTGWNTRSDGNGDSYSDKESVKNLATSGTKTLYAQWRDLETYTVIFDTVGEGTSSEATRVVKEGKAVGELPTGQASITDYKLEGWYTNKQYTEKVTKDTIINSDVTFYAKWKYKFVTVFSLLDEVKFNGTDPVDTTDERFIGQNHVNTGVKLFNDEETMRKDFEIGFEIVEYNPTSNINQATMLNVKYENDSLNYPGFAFRRNNKTDKLELTLRTKSSGSGKVLTYAYADIHKVTIIRRNLKLYIRIDNGTLTELGSCQDLLDRGVYFDTPVTFGTSLDSSNAPIRSMYGTLKNMYIKLED